MDEGFSIIDDENKDDFETILGRTIIQLRIPMLCPDCDDVHFVPVTASALPKVGGVGALILLIQNKLTAKGFTIPTEADMKLWSNRLEAAMKAAQEMETYRQEAQARGAVYIPRTSREGGDA